MSATASPASSTAARIAWQASSNRVRGSDWPRRQYGVRPTPAIAVLSRMVRSDTAVPPSRVPAAPVAGVEGVVVDRVPLPGQGVDELDGARLLVRRDPLPAVLDELV